MNIPIWEKVCYNTNRDREELFQRIGNLLPCVQPPMDCGKESS